jgi:hypothetical protein
MVFEDFKMVLNNAHTHLWNIEVYILTSGNTEYITSSLTYDKWIHTEGTQMDISSNKLDSDGEQCQQYQQYEQQLFTLNSWTQQRLRHTALEMKNMDRDRHNNLAGLNRLKWSQHSFTCQLI